MKTIRISEDVWDAIAARGKFGETVDDVLRKVFDITEPIKTRTFKGGTRRNKATNRMSANVERNKLIVEFQTGDRNEWELPDIDDKNGIRSVRDSASEFAEKIGATLGQVNAVKKALTDAGYYVSR